MQATRHTNEDGSIEITYSLTRAEAERIIRKTAPADVIEDVDSNVIEYECDDPDYDFVYGFFSYIEMYDNSESPRSFKLAIGRVMIALGFWVSISEEDARESVRDGIGVKLSHFPKIDGQRYDVVHANYILTELK